MVHNGKGKAFGGHLMIINGCPLAVSRPVSDVRAFRITSRVGGWGASEKKRVRVELAKAKQCITHSGHGAEDTACHRRVSNTVITTIFKKSYCISSLLNSEKKEEQNKFRAIYINMVKVLYCLKICVSVFGSVFIQNVGYIR